MEQPVVQTAPPPQDQRTFARPTLTDLRRDPCPMAFNMQGRDYAITCFPHDPWKRRLLVETPVDLAAARSIQDLLDMGFDGDQLDWASNYFLRSVDIVWPDGRAEGVLQMDPTGFVVWIRDMCEAASFISKHPQCAETIEVRRQELLKSTPPSPHAE